MSELKQALQKSNNSAAGPDEVHYNLLTHSSESVLSVLLKSLKLIWESETFLPSWREAVVVPIAKAGKDPKNPTNYRPIALTSCLCKTMECIVNAQLMWCMESEGHLADVQCGFRKNRFTVDHLVRFESFVREAFIKKEHVVAIFFLSGGVRHHLEAWHITRPTSTWFSRSIALLHQQFPLRSFISSKNRLDSLWLSCTGERCSSG